MESRRRCERRHDGLVNLMSEGDDDDEVKLARRLVCWAGGGVTKGDDSLLQVRRRVAVLR